MGRKGRPQVDYQERNWGGHQFPWKEGVGIHSLDSKCFVTYAWEENHAQGFKTCEYLYWLVGELEGWWPWVE